MFHEVVCIFAEATRDRDLSAFFRQGLTEQERVQIAEWASVRLVKRIGGRYVRTVDAWVARDAAVVQAFTGNNHTDLMRQFRISRRLVYSIVARVRRTAGR